MKVVEAQVKISELAAASPKKRLKPKRRVVSCSSIQTVMKKGGQSKQSKKKQSNLPCQLPALGKHFSQATTSSRVIELRQVSAALQQSWYPVGDAADSSLLGSIFASEGSNDSAGGRKQDRITAT